MSIVRDSTQILAFLAALSLLAPLPAMYMEKVFRSEKTPFPDFSAASNDSPAVHVQTEPRLGSRR